MQSACLVGFFLNTYFSGYKKRQPIGLPFSIVMYDDYFVIAIRLVSF